MATTQSDSGTADKQNGFRRLRILLGAVLACGLLIPLAIAALALTPEPAGHTTHPSLLPLAASAVGCQLALIILMRHLTRRNDDTRAALAASEERYRQIVEASPFPILIYRDQRVVYSNPAAIELLAGGGDRADQLLGLPLDRLIAPSSEETLRAAFARAARQGGLQRNPIMQIRALDGRIIDLESVSVAVTLDGQPARMIFGQDVTGLHEAEQALRQSEQRYRSLFENSQDAILLADDGARYQDANPAACALLGYTLDELRQRHVWDVTPDANQELGRAMWHDFIQAGRMGGEYRLRRKDGQLVEAEFRAVASVLPGLHLSVLRDISDRKRAEEELRESRARRQAIFDHSSDGLFIVQAGADNALRVMLSNPAFKQLAGAPAAALAGPVGEQIAALCRQCLHANRPVQQESQVELDGETVWWLCTLTPVSPDGGDVRQLIGVLVDITAQKAVQSALKDYTHALEAQMLRQERLAALGQLAAGVGHELRNPLANIAAAVYFLRNVPPDETSRRTEYWSLIDDEVRGAEKIVSDLLDFGRVVTAQRMPVPVDELTGRALDRCTPPQTVRVVLDLPPDLPPVLVDRQQIEQVLCNLITNACQAMPAGGELRLSARPAANDQITLALQDSGIGVPPDQLKNLFEPLYTTKPRGIGMGLAISKKLAEANGGWISARSELGRGSTFTLLLPVAPSQESSPDAAR